MYNLNWYIGRTLKYEDRKRNVKCLKPTLISFEWPREVNIQVYSKYITYDQINIIGCRSFTLKC